MNAAPGPRRTPMHGVDIAPLRSDDADLAARLLASAFDVDPLHRAVYGADVRARSEGFYRTRLANGAGSWYAASRGEALLGVVHWRSVAGDEASGLVDEAARAQLAWVDRIAGAVFRWTMAGTGRGTMDAGRETAPVILGPLAVWPASRGQGIGGRLMARFCAELDARRDAGYLETAQPANVRFYERFGFSIVDEFELVGVPCIAMHRAPG